MIHLDYIKFNTYQKIDILCISRNINIVLSEYSPRQIIEAE